MKRNYKTKSMNKALKKEIPASFTAKSCGQCGVKKQTHMRGEVRDGRGDGKEGLHCHRTLGQPGGQQHEDPQASEHLGASLEDGHALLHQGHWWAANAGSQLYPQHVLLCRKKNVDK